MPYLAKWNKTSDDVPEKEVQTINRVQPVCNSTRFKTFLLVSTSFEHFKKYRYKTL